MDDLDLENEDGKSNNSGKWLEMGAFINFQFGIHRCKKMILVSKCFGAAQHHYSFRINAIVKQSR